MNHLPKNINLDLNFNTNNLKEIYLAGGCYWGTQAYMDRIKGVYSSTVGFANGTLDNPSYKDVCEKETGHAETVHIKYDPQYTTLKTLLLEYFSTINPTSLNKQGGDIGSQYRTGIYYTNEKDIEVIEEVLKIKEQDYDKEIVVEVMPLKCYYEAEESHQKYLEKNPEGYCHVNLDVLNNKKQ